MMEWKISTLSPLLYVLKTKHTMRHNFLHLEIWKRSRKLVKLTYNVTKPFPSEEKFGLTSQMRRAAVSIPSNIAEGCGRDTDAQLKHFIGNAIGSLCELETQVYLSFDLEYIPESIMSVLVKEITEIRRMSMSFQNRL